MTEFKYAGSELDLFAKVVNWKSYWSRQMAPFIAGDVLEVGAGMGANTPFVDRGTAGNWVCLEPDAALASELSGKLKRKASPPYETICGTLRTLDAQRLFDTILYVDVLEHIEDDREELRLASAHLRPHGRLVVLSPAHQWLFSPFDASIGHHRRYNRAMLRRISPDGLRLERLRYLDCAGLSASASNMLLRQPMPTAAQLQFWDRWIVPISRVLDPVFLYSLGKSILAVWRL